MKITNPKRMFYLLLCVAIIVAVSIFAVGCNENTTSSSITLSTQVTELGNGNTAFTFTVTDINGNDTVFIINTDKSTVGEALFENNLISGDAGPFGLYVKTVNNISLDYNTDGYYWSFYVNGKYATSGVDTTNITQGSSYAFKAEKS